MNKKGFTLIEVIVSVVLVSLVMVTLTSTLVELKKKSEVVALNTDAVVYSSIISRIVNNDITENNGVKFIECDPNGEECGMVLGNNDKRSITLKETSDTRVAKVEKVEATGNYILKDKSNNSYINKVDVTMVNGGQLSYCNNTDRLNANCLAVLINGNKCTCFKEKISSTLLYKDITAETTTGLLNSNTTSGKVKYIKTLSYIKTTDPDTNKVSTEGYGFSRIYYDQYPYAGKNGDTNILTRLTVGIYDGIDKNAAAYNASLYSASRTNADAPKVGDKFTITLNTVGNLNAPHGVVYPKVQSITRPEIDSFPVTRLTEKFNVGFEVVNPGVYVDDAHTSVGIGETQTFTSFTSLPSMSGKIFMGYFTAKGTETECAGTMVINNSGHLTVASNYFLEDSEIFACWL